MPSQSHYSTAGICVSIAVEKMLRKCYKKLALGEKWCILSYGLYRILRRQEGIQMRQYIVDAFTDQVFHGNQAAICVMEHWLPEETMKLIARENCFSETAFTVQEGEAYHLRWFTPGGEIDLCGHATLACAHVLLTRVMPEAEQVTFHTLSGDLVVRRKGDLLEMTFPAYALQPVPVTENMTRALGVEPVAAYMGRDLLCVLQSEEQVRILQPDQSLVA